MRKIDKIIGIIGIVGLAMMLVTSAMGASTEMMVGRNGIDVVDRGNVQRIHHIVEEEVREIEVYAANMRVRVIGGDELAIGGAVREDALEIDVVDGLLTVRHSEGWRGISIGFRGIRGLARQELVVSVPRDMMERVRVESGNGRVEIARIFAGDIEVVVRNGRIEIEDIGATGLWARSNNGRIEVRRAEVVHSGLAARNGAIRVSDSMGRFEARSHNGSVRFERVPSGAFVDLRTRNGGVRVDGQRQGSSFRGGDENAEDAVIAETHNGSVRVEF